MRRDDGLVLVRYRLEQANEALADAEFLLAGHRGPRSIVNRAYYAMFYAVLALLQSIGEGPSRTPAQSAYSRQFVLKGAFANEHSAWLHRAFELRQTTDYRVEEPDKPGFRMQIPECRMPASDFWYLTSTLSGERTLQLTAASGVTRWVSRQPPALLR